MLLLAIPAGALIGLSLGALGGGGSILTVPVLVYLLSVSPHNATTASLIIVGLTSLVGMMSHLRAGRVQLRSGIIFGVLGAGGAYLGSRLSASVDPNVLLAAFSVLILGAAVTMLRRRRSGGGKPGQAATADALPAGPPPAGTDEPGTGGFGAVDEHTGQPGRIAVLHRPARTDTPERVIPRVSPVRVVVAASVVGLLTGFFGVGGGFVVVPALILALGFDMPMAVGTSLLVIAINSATSLLSRLSTHSTLDLGLLIAFTAAAMVGSLAGSRIASRTRPERLVGAFALLMVGVAVYTAVKSVPHLF